MMLYNREITLHSADTGNEARNTASSFFTRRDIRAPEPQCADRAAPTNPVVRPAQTSLTVGQRLAFIIATPAARPYDIASFLFPILKADLACLTSARSDLSA